MLRERGDVVGDRVWVDVLGDEASDTDAAEVIEEGTERVRHRGTRVLNEW